MNKEESNELARSGKFEVMAKTGLPPKEVERKRSANDTLASLKATC